MRERRANARYRVWFPVTIVVDGQETTAITFDVSASGGLLASPSEIAAGTAIVLRFQFELGTAPRDIEAEVLRCGPSGDQLGPWQHRLAVQFSAPQPDLEAVLLAAPKERDA